MEDEAVLIVNKNVPTGYSTTMRSWMKPEDVEYFPPQIGTHSGDSEPGIQIDAGDPPADPIRRKRKARNGRT